MKELTPEEIKRYTSYLGKKSYEARLKRLGKEKIQEIARKNGKKGGRPKGTKNKAKELGIDLNKI